MPKTHFPRTGGQQWVDSFYRSPLATMGNVFFVNSATGTSTGPGYSPETAFATIDQGISACTAGNHDVVVVMAGHTETITAASGIDLDVAGVTVLGMGVGTNRPTVTFGTATTATIDFSAANCTLENIRCVNNIDSLAAFVEGGASNATIKNCDFIGSSTKEFLCGVSVPTTFDDWTIDGCRFVQPTDPGGSNGGAGTGCVYMQDSENVRISNCEFIGCFESALIHNKTTAAANLVVKNCYGYQPTGTADSLPFILVSTATGACLESYFVNLNETQVTEATLSGTFGASFFNGQSFFGNDGGGGQNMVASQSAAA